jgi:hypothetical protein
MSIVKHFKSSHYLELEHNKTFKLPPLQMEGFTELGVLKTLQPLPTLSKTPLDYSYKLLSVMGSDLPLFPGSDTVYDVEKVQASKKEEITHSWGLATKKRVETLKHIRASYIR